MITIKEIDKCCGCGACAQACPKQCIKMEADKEGFLYPVINKPACADCGKCEKVCPISSKNGVKEDSAPDKIMTLAAINPDHSTRLKSSSGGIFSLLAERVIKAGGAVFGAVFDDEWNVRHTMAETMEQVALMRGSKYVQSTIGNTFSLVKGELQKGRQVLFSGTPCQVKGLHSFLGKEYPNLLTVDFICHGVPSPMVWQEYLKEVVQYLKRSTPKNAAKTIGKHSIHNISFRDKQFGWKDYGFCLDFAAPKKEEALIGQSGMSSFGKNSHPDNKSMFSLRCTYDEDPFMQAFLGDVCLRPSCHACHAKAGRSGSDITLGDFWGIDRIDRDFNDDKGVSIVRATGKGIKIVEEMDAITKSLDIEHQRTADNYNPAYTISAARPPYRDLFMKTVRRQGFYAAHKRVFSRTLFQRVARRLWLLRQ